MARTRTRTTRAGGIAALLSATLIVAACGSSSSSSPSSAAASSSAASATSASNGYSSSPSTGASTSVAIGTAKGPAGTYLVGASGRALYLWVPDKNGKSTCYGACAQVWPPVIAKSTPKVSGGANMSDLGTTTRKDGTKQVTYMGHPLYYYVADSHAGTTIGEGSNSFGAKWWLVAPSGKAITSGHAAKGKSSHGGSWG